MLKNEKRNSTNNAIRYLFVCASQSASGSNCAKISCKTDFALKTDIVQKIGNQIAMQASAFGGLDSVSDWMFDSSKKVKDVLHDVTQQLGEPFVIEQLTVVGS